MIRFENIEFLYALLAIPLFIVIFMLMMNWKKKAIRRFGDISLVNRLMPAKSQSRPVVKFVILMLAYIFLVFGVANPQTGSKLEEMKRKGIDMIIALDVSNSMLAEDIEPNRLERAKQAISKLIDRLDGDRIGIIIFAGKAYLQLPITTDYSAAKLFLFSISTDVVPAQGTAIGEAIQTAVSSFDDNDHSKAIIIITDGENHEGNAVEAAQAAAEKDIKIYTIGMGSIEGAPIPIYNKYGNQTGYKKDSQGNTVITKLDKKMLQQIASSGDGIFVRADNVKAGLNKIFEKINKLEETEFKSKVYSDYEDRFQYLLGAALILILIEIVIADRKSEWAGKIKLFG